MSSNLYIGNLGQTFYVSLYTPFNLIINLDLSYQSSSEQVSENSSMTNSSNTYNVPPNFLPPSNNNNQTLSEILASSENPYQIQIINTTNQYNNISDNSNQILLANSKSSNPYFFLNQNVDTYTGVNKPRPSDVNPTFNFYNTDYNFSNTNTNMKINNYLTFSELLLGTRSIYKFSPVDTEPEISLFNKLNNSTNADKVYIYPENKNINPKPNLQLVLENNSINSSNPDNISNTTNIIYTTTNKINFSNKPTIYSILSANSSEIPIDLTYNLRNPNIFSQIKSGQYYMIINNREIFNIVGTSNSNSSTSQILFTNIVVLTSNLTIPIYSATGNQNSIIGVIYIQAYY